MLFFGYSFTTPNYPVQNPDVSCASSRNNIPSGAELSASQKQTGFLPHGARHALKFRRTLRKLAEQNSEGSRIRKSKRRFLPHGKTIFKRFPKHARESRQRKNHSANLSDMFFKYSPSFKTYLDKNISRGLLGAPQFAIFIFPPSPKKYVMSFWGESPLRSRAKNNICIPPAPSASIARK